MYAAGRCASRDRRGGRRRQRPGRSTRRSAHPGRPPCPGVRICRASPTEHRITACSWPGHRRPWPSSSSAAPCAVDDQGARTGGSARDPRGSVRGARLRAPVRPALAFGGLEDRWFGSRHGCATGRARPSAPAYERHLPQEVVSAARRGAGAARRAPPPGSRHRPRRCAAP